MLIYEIKNGIEITGYNEEKLREANGVLIIPEYIDGIKVTTIREQVFEGCEDVKKVVIEGNIFLDWACFSGCFNMTSFTAPKITGLEMADIFRYCEALTEVDLSNVKSIEHIGTFEHCKTLKKLELPKLKRIYSWGVFSYMRNLEYLSLPNLEETGSLTIIAEDGKEIELIKTVNPTTYYKHLNADKDLHTPSLKKLTIPKQLINENIDLSELNFEINLV